MHSCMITTIIIIILLLYYYDDLRTGQGGDGQDARGAGEAAVGGAARGICLQVVKY